MMTQRMKRSILALLVLALLLVAATSVFAQGDSA